jgi:EAL domain-containing protein (putative c-di-GMP-specific phosphodiesterase class I)
MASAVEDPGVSVESMLAAVEGGGLSPGQVTFELVDAESCLDRTHLLSVVETYRDAGFRISLDDVGAGGATLLRLEELRPDYVKLDAGVCRGALTGVLEAEMLHDLAEAARQQGVVAVAKGLENVEQLRFAMDAGVRVTQGFVHAQPAPTPLDASAEDRVLQRVRVVAQIIRG